jgi:hypothetical protein
MDEQTSFAPISTVPVNVWHIVAHTLSPPLDGWLEHVSLIV